MATPEHKTGLSTEKTTTGHTETHHHDAVSAAPAYNDDIIGDRTQHNASPQVGVKRNDDPALDIAHEHHHGHVHHSGAAARKSVDDPVYTKETTDKPILVSRNSKDSLHRRTPHAHNGTKEGIHVHDAEKGDLSRSASEEDDPRTHRFSNIYQKIKIYIHIILFLLFTGSVNSRMLRNTAAQSS